MAILTPQGRLSKNGANTEEAASETDTERNEFLGIESEA